jgi:hypothetical protein
MRGISIAFFPTSWAFGPWELQKKWLFAAGPFRFVYHRCVAGDYGEFRGAIEPYANMKARIARTDKGH